LTPPTPFPLFPLFSSPFLDILIFFVAGLILFVGLTWLALRRRNEILQDYLTPEEPDIEQEFFRRREKPKADESTAEEPPNDAESESAADETGWGPTAVQA